MYLNLDLLYNVDNYLFPLFYYKYRNPFFKNEYKIYSPVIKKSILKIKIDDIYFDFITKKYRNESSDKFFNYADVINGIFTENTINYPGCCIYNKCKPFNLTKKEIVFLKSNTRIN